MKQILVAVLAIAASAGCAEKREVTGNVGVPNAVPAAASTSAAPAVSGAARLPDFTALVESSGSAVVNIVTSRRPAAARAGAQQDPFGEFFRRFMPNVPEGEAQARPQQGQGSGFIISEDGYILTNAHVVAASDEVTVRLADAKREFRAKVVGADSRTDVALLKVEATGLPTVRIGSVEKLEVGEWVAAIGSPFGFANTITAGIVSAKGRNLPDEYFVPFIQTDVAVNPGNSGGPLLSLRGEVVGINSMIYSGTGGYMGLSFAIPIDVAMDVGNQLRTTGRVTRGRLGVALQTLTPELAQSFGLEKSAGALITRIEPGTPAAQAGLQAGDVIVRYNGEPIDDPAEVTRLVAGTKPGTAVPLQVWRQRGSRDLTVTIGELPSAAVARAAPAPAVQKGSRLGFGVSVLPPDGRKALGVPFGLVIESIDPEVKAPQVQLGDVIIAVNNAEFTSIEQFNRIVDQQKPGSTIPLLLRRGEGALYIAVRVKSAP